MAVVVDTEKCNACKSCEEACPSQAIKCPESVAIVNPDDCIDCNACIDVCQSGALSAG